MLTLDRAADDSRVTRENTVDCLRRYSLRIAQPEADLPYLGSQESSAGDVKLGSISQSRIGCRSLQTKLMGFIARECSPIMTPFTARGGEDELSPGGSEVDMGGDLRQDALKLDDCSQSRGRVIRWRWQAAASWIRTPSSATAVLILHLYWVGSW